MIHLSRRTAAVLAALNVVLFLAPAHAQIPEEFTNLKFYPEDIQKPELVEQMRQFCFALGVRCTHCHVSSEENPGRVSDFASDDLTAKRKARAMLKMMREINEAHLARLPERDEAEVSVSCATCHGGVSVPMRLENRLGLVHEAAGPDSAVALYRQLREDYHGSDAFDFGPRSLMNLSERLGEEAPQDAAVYLELNREFFPESLEIHFNLARAYHAAERTEDAVAAYEKVLELSPQGGWANAARQAIEELTGAAGGE